MTSPNLSLPTLVRVGGLPASAVPAPGPELLDALEDLHRLEASVQRAGQDMLDPLYEIVPGLERQQRRAVLRAKRRIFQGRATGIPQGEAEGLPEPAGTMLTRWDALMSRIAQARERLETAVAVDMERSRQVLATGLDEPGYLRSLAIAAPGLVAEIVRRGPRLEDPRQVRSLYALATRAGLKTSPFSGLTMVAEAGRAGNGRRLCTVAVHLAHGLLMQAAGEVDTTGSLVIEAAPVRQAVPVLAESEEASGQAAWVGPLAIVGEHSYADGLPFRQERVQPARWLLAAHRALSADQDGSADRPGSGTRPHREAAPCSPVDRPAVSLEEAGRRLGGPQPRRRLERLLAAGALHVRPPWIRGQDPFPALGQALSQRQREAWRQDLERLGALAPIVEVADGPARAELLTRGKEISGRIFPDGELGTRPGGLLYEDCESPLAWDDPLSQEPFRQDVEALADMADPWVTRSHIYDLLVERFIARYGRGGICEDPLAFVMTLAHAPDGDTEMMQAAVRDLAGGPSPERAAMAGGLSGAPRHMGAYLQPVAGPGQDAGLIVVGGFTNGNGSAQARFHRLLGQDYGQRLASGIRQAWGLDRVLELQVSTDCNTGQAIASGLLPPLGLPGEPGAPDAVGLSTLRLVHDPATSTLFLADSQGPVGLAYLGLTAQHLLGGYLAWLVLIAEPWARLPPMADHWTSRERDRTGPRPDRLVHSPRVTDGRLVTRRESWTFPAGELTGLLEADLTDSLLGVAGLRERWGLPAQVYAHQHLPPRGATFDEHKPFYADLTCPASLLALRGWIDDSAEHLSLIEALPGREQVAGTTGSGRATALEYLVSVQWPKSGEGGQ